MKIPGLSQEYTALFKKLKTPEKIQDYIDGLSMNFEEGGDTCRSAAETLRHGEAHCIEAAFVAAAALWSHGRPPLLLDLQADENDYDHVVTLFRSRNCWGAISKSNHLWLRWRDPVYRSLRELAMSYFHEYVSGAQKTLRSYSAAFDLRRQDASVWLTGEQPCWSVAEALDRSRHYSLITPAQEKLLRPRDALELCAGKILEHK